MTNLYSVLKSKDIACFADKGLYSQSYGFPVMSCESWTIKKANTKELMLSNCGKTG